MWLVETTPLWLHMLLTKSTLGRRKTRTVISTENPVCQENTGSSIEKGKPEDTGNIYCNREH